MNGTSTAEIVKTETELCHSESSPTQGSPKSQTTLSITIPPIPSLIPPIPSTDPASLPSVISIELRRPPPAIPTLTSKFFFCVNSLKEEIGREDAEELKREIERTKMVSSLDDSSALTLSVYEENNSKGDLSSGVDELEIKQEHATPLKCVLWNK